MCEHTHTPPIFTYKNFYPLKFKGDPAMGTVSLFASFPIYVLEISSYQYRYVYMDLYAYAYMSTCMECIMMYQMSWNVS